MPCARSAISKGLLAAFAVALAGCGVVRESNFRPVCPSYEQAVRPVVEASCAECHGAARAEGGYVVGEYLGTVSRRPDGSARVAPGDTDSLFLQAVRGELPGHTALDAAKTSTLERWVVECRAATGEYQYHPQGWSTPTETGTATDGGAAFHGKALRQRFYRFDECQKCHGEDLRGGGSEKDCATCHAFQPNGELACNTCHGDATSPAPPRDLNGGSLTTSLGVGAHRAHVQAGDTHRAFACADCHRDVKRLEDDGHYRAAGKFQADGGAFWPAEVFLKGNGAGAASWDRTAATCTNSACHAPFPNDTSASREDPVWTTKDQRDCGSCHGAPPSNHSAGATQCENCHGAGYADGGADPATHVNGTVEYKGDLTRCDSCHGGPNSPAFFDLQGRDAGVKVGAHDAHLKANKLRGPMTCNECHLVPATLFSPGHIDTGSPAEVFPAGSSGLASAQGFMPVYTAANATCSNYCHSGGDVAGTDMSTGLNRTPSWTGAADTAACGKCHGLPPLDGTQAHQLAASGTPCASCHGGAVNADGGIRFSTLPDGGTTSRHLDGLLTGQ